MNREIKFRAWEKNEQQMIPNVESGVYEDPDEIIDFDTVLSLERFVVMQFTGLKDKNGTEIYEGDILQEQTTHPLEVFIKDGHVNVRYVDMGEKVEEWLFQSEIYEDDLEVVGNIYENPELLEGE